MKRQRSRGRVALAGAAAMCAMVALPGQAWAAGEPNPYVFQPEAKQITGATTTSDAKPLDPGSTYRDSIGPGGKLIYRLDLDAKTNAYVSAVAVPKLGTKVAFGDKIEVSLQNRQGNDCSSNDARFGTSGEYPRPLAAYAYRLIEKGAYSCQEEGPYFVVIERTSEAGSTPDPWDLEIRHVSEPGLKEAGPTQAPSVWPSASPVPVGGAPRVREGGTSFYDAKGLAQGEWTAKIEPGASLFYRVPVDWGQQLYASADLGSSDGEGFVSGAFAVSLYNPARGLVDSSDSVSYDGKQKTTALDPLPPVAYENRFGFSTGDKDMRFAGWYYLRVSLHPEVAEKFGAKPYGLTLRVNVKGQARSGPGYAGPAGDFTVTPEKLDDASNGQSGADVARSDMMQLVAAAGIGAGTVLVLGLGVWTLLARRRADQGAGQSQGPDQGQGQLPGQGPADAPTRPTHQYGPPPSGW
ncbi:hypothetical protein ACFVWX_02575 [Streptomyces sp. NPDC058220]|uniref:hypothetical protein n=1 Tax=Streptomyces sp. NPDC058220 TaxID=3346387 RepID=UPI0036E1BE5E